MSLYGARADDLLYPQGFRINVGDLLLASFTINILSLALPVMTLQVYDRLLPNPGSGTLPVLITGVCIAIVLECIMRLGRSYVMGWAGASFEHRLSCRAMNHILNADLSIPSNFGIGENLNRLSSIGRLKDFYNGYSLVTIFELIFVPLFLLLIAYIAGPLVIIPTVILMVFTIVSLIQGKTLLRDLEERDLDDDERYNFLIESLEGIHTIKSFALENTFSRRYESLEEKSTIANFKVTESAASTFNTGAVFASIMVTGVIAFGAVLVLNNQITVGALVATILLSGRIMQPTQRALGLWAKYQDYVLSRQKVESIFEIPLHKTTPHEGDKPEREGTLSLHNVSFRFSDDAPWLLQNVNLNLDRGDFICLQADHTPSKTALLDLIAGIYAPTQGEIEVDRYNTLRYSPEELTNHVGYIQSDGLIFRGTIRDNMTCFGLIEEAKVQEIAALLHVDKDIASLPSGFDTFLSGGNTDTIPPGLKQRISMVRVLAPKPRIILFDNADRSLDRQGYNLVYNLLARLKNKATIILCSDDQNLATQANRSFSLRNSILTETTTTSSGH
jgi:ATP-binding cassette subfamily C protein LapB